MKPHHFRSHEWSQSVTEKKLIDELRYFQTAKDGPGFSLLDAYYPNGWTENAIRFFLELNCDLYPESLPQEHHVRCIVTLISRGKVR